jgi:hypothetical protein
MTCSKEIETVVAQDPDSGVQRVFMQVRTEVGDGFPNKAAARRAADIAVQLEVMNDEETTTEPTRLSS